MKKTLVLQDTEQPHRSNALLEVAFGMYGKQHCESWLLCYTEAHDSILEGFDHVVVVKDGDQAVNDVRGICTSILSLYDEHCFDSILIPGTWVGRMVAPRLAKQLKVGLIAEINDIQKKDGTLEFIRTAYSGNVLCGISMQSKSPVLLTIKGGIFSYKAEGTPKAPTLEYIAAPTPSPTMKCLKRSPLEQSYDIRDSEVLVSGGGGAKKVVLLLQELAKALHGQVSASRKLVDQGLAERTIQVGQSGKVVNPKLYVAVGIDGAIQHVEGLRDVETLISINTREDAPICSISDFVVVGDAKICIEKLLKRIGVGT